MNKNEKKGLAPKLRFPEFSTTGEWKTTSLSNLAKKITTRNQDNLINHVLTNSAVEGVVSQSDYFDREVANPNNLENYFVIDEGDYVYNPRISATAPVGPISKNKVGKGVVSPLYTVFRFENHNNDFYEQYFKSNFWHPYLKNVSNTGARHDRMSISTDNFMLMPLPYHIDEEQQKIADCLSSLDDLIAAENKKLDTIKAHKNGFMQKLFPAEGETVPELRFPEFRESDEWEERKLSNVCAMQAGKFVHASEIFKVRKDNMHPCYGGNGLRGYTYTYTHSGEYPLIGRQGALCGNVTYGVGEFHATEHAVVATKSEGIIEKWLYYLLINLKLNQYATGQAQPGLSVETLEKIATYVPRDEEEQKKIADCLSSIDTLITAQAEKIETLIIRKNGLLQRLFPSIEEVGE
jgi:type I restriction enzyme, S subunit